MGGGKTRLVLSKGQTYTLSGRSQKSSSSLHPDHEYSAGPSVCLTSSSSHGTEQKATLTRSTPQSSWWGLRRHLPNLPLPWVRDGQVGLGKLLDEGT